MIGNELIFSILFRQGVHQEIILICTLCSSNRTQPPEDVTETDVEIVDFLLHGEVFISFLFVRPLVCTES